MPCTIQFKSLCLASSFWTGVEKEVAEQEDHNHKGSSTLQECYRMGLTLLMQPESNTVVLCAALSA